MMIVVEAASIVCGTHKHRRKGGYANQAYNNVEQKEEMRDAPVEMSMSVNPIKFNVLNVIESFYK